MKQVLENSNWKYLLYPLFAAAIYLLYEFIKWLVKNLRKKGRNTM